MQENARNVYQALKNHPLDLSEQAIAGIMGTIHKETGGTFDFEQKQKGGPGYGLFQYDAQKPAYNRYLNKITQPDSIDTQIEFTLDNIMNKTDLVGAGNAQAIMDAFKSGDARDVAEIFTTKYLKPKDVVNYEKAGKDKSKDIVTAYQDNIGSRQDLAENYFGQFGQQETQPTQVAQAEVGVPDTSFPEKSGDAGIFSGLFDYLRSGNGDKPLVPSATQMGLGMFADGDDNITQADIIRQIQMATGQERANTRYGRDGDDLGTAPTGVPAIPPAEPNVPEVPVVPEEPTAPINPDVRTYTRFGKSIDYQKVGDDYYRIKPDGSLARDPASGLTLANLENPDSQLVSPSTTPSAFVPPQDNTDPYMEVPKATPEPPKPKVPVPEQPASGSTYFHPPSNTQYTLNEFGILVDAYGRPAPANIQDQFNQKKAGTAEKERTIPELDVVPQQIPESSDLQKQIDSARDKGQKEISTRGEVTPETATTIAQLEGQKTQSQKVERDKQAQAEADAAEAQEQALSDYEKAVESANASGLKPPTFEEWSKTQQTTSDDGYANSVNDNSGLTSNQEQAQTNPDEAYRNAETDLSNSLANANQDDRENAGAAKQIIEQMANDPSKSVQEKLSFFDEFKKELGNMFTGGAVASALVGYAGTLLFGGSHAQAGKQAGVLWANYNKAQKELQKSMAEKRADFSKQLTTNAKELLKEGFTPESVELYTRTGNEAVLQRKSSATGAGAPAGAAGTLTTKKGNIKGQTYPVYNFGKEHGDYFKVGSQYISVTDPRLDSPEIGGAEIYDSSDHSDSSVRNYFTEYAASSASAKYIPGNAKANVKEFKVPNWNKTRIASQANKAFQNIRREYGVNVSQYGEIQENIGYAIDDMRDYQIANPKEAVELRPFIDARMLKVEAQQQQIPDTAWSGEYGTSTAKGLAKVDREIRNNLKQKGDLAEYRADLSNAYATFMALADSEKQRLQSKGEANGLSAFGQFILE
jgi:hypothetical protein